MKNIFSILLFIPLAPHISAQPGLPDANFGTAGKVTVAASTLFDEAKAVVLQPDGKIIVAGRAKISGIYHLALVRLLPNGSLDPSFGTTGKVTTAIGPKQDEAYAVALQPDGKIVVAGRIFNGTNFDFALLRYHPNGSLDNSFHTTGIVTTAIGPNNDEAYAVTIQADGKIVVAGHADNGTNADFALLRYLPDGTLDGSFGSAGIVRTDFGTHDDKAMAMALQTDGKIVVAGWSFNGANEDFALARYQSDGTLDPAFHNDGRQTTDFTVSPKTYQDYGRALLIQPDGMIVVAGYSDISMAKKIISLARYETNGDMDNGFGVGGKVTVSLNIVGIGDVAHAVALQTDGKIVVAGSVHIAVYENFDFALLRLTSDGKLDQSFGNGGKVMTDFGVTNDQILAVTIQPDGKILAVGDNRLYFALARYLSGLNVGVLDFSIDQHTMLAYPNPVRDNAVSLTYTLAKPEQLAVELFDQQGKLIQTLVPRTGQLAGKHQVDLRLPNDLASGVYVIVLSANSTQVGVQIVR
jgi:uncharacterized delta-60 repeat protein